MVGATDGPVDGRSTRWEAHRARRREQLVEAGLAALNEVGSDFGIERVAERAGVTKPVIYRHFDDRADLLEAIGRRATEILIDERIMPAIETGGPLRPRVRSVVAAVVGCAEDYPQVYRFFESHVPAEGGDSVSRVVKDLIAGVLAVVIGEALCAGGRDAETAEVWAHGLVGFVQSVIEWWLDRRTMSAEKIVEHLTELVWDQMDGFARRHGVVLDPEAALDLDEITRQVNAARA